MINFGTQSFTAIELGTQSISAVYWGTQSVYSAVEAEVFIYLAHQNQNTSSAGNTVTKINQSRVIQWQNPSPWLTSFGSQTIDIVAKNNKIYTAQSTGNSSAAGTSSVYDSNGVVLGTYTHNNRTPNAVNADSVGNIIIGGLRDTAVPTNSLRKLNGTTFAVIWRYDHNTTVNSISVDSSNNVYFGGNVNTSSISIRKLNSSGVSQWSANHGAVVNKVLTDASGNLYVAGLTGTSGFTLRKYNTSGTLQWSRGLNTQGQLRGLAFDSLGNIWAGGATATGNATWSVAEYNTSGTPLGYYNFGNVQDLQIDTSDNVYVATSIGTSVGTLRKYDSSGVLSWTYSVPNNRFIRRISLTTY